MEYEITEVSNDGYTISTDRSRLNLDVVHGYLSRSYWAAGIPKDLIRRAVSNSYCFGLYRGSEQIGFARIITGFARHRMLCDVFVLKPHRGKGPGHLARPNGRRFPPAVRVEVHLAWHEGCPRSLCAVRLRSLGRPFRNDALPPRHEVVASGHGFRMSERRPTLVIITGPPGAGKTTLARNLARQVSVPLIVKDDIKEALFDTLGWSDRAWSRKVGAASFEILWRLVDDHLALGISLMVETAFHQVPDSGRVESLVDRHGNSCVQVYVAAPPNILYERFRHRATSGDRHERHVDHLADYSTFQELYDRCSPLRIGAPLIEVDTIEFANVDTQAITDRLRPLL